jgi:CRAL/TRIO domain
MPFGWFSGHAEGSSSKKEDPRSRSDTVEVCHAESIDVARFAGTVATQPSQSFLSWSQTSPVPELEPFFVASSGKDSGKDDERRGSDDLREHALAKIGALRAWLAERADEDGGEKGLIDTIAAFGGEKSCFFRFLKAEQFDVERSGKKLIACAAFRRESDVGASWGLVEPPQDGGDESSDSAAEKDPASDIDAATDRDSADGPPPDRLARVTSLRPWWTGQFIGLSRHGCPVMYTRLSFLNPPRLLAEEGSLDVFYLWWMENSLGLQRMGQDRIRGSDPDEPGDEPFLPGSIEIFDASGLSMSLLMSAVGAVRRFASAVGVGELYYPVHDRRCFIINSPAVFSATFNLVSKLMSAEAREMTVMTSHNNKEALLEFLDEDVFESMFESVEDPAR